MTTPFPTDLTDAQRALIKPMPPATRSGTFRGGRPGEVDLRTIVNGILYSQPHRLLMAIAPAELRVLGHGA